MKKDFKVGDTVFIIEPTDKQKKHYNCIWMPDMSKYSNKKATIVKKANSKNCYKIDLDNRNYWWDPVSFKKEITNNQLVWI